MCSAQIPMKMTYSKIFNVICDSLILKQIKSNILGSLCLFLSYVFVQREALKKVAQLRNFVRFFHTKP